jgi:succinoglycan biosynthesis protein ExoM
VSAVAVAHITVCICTLRRPQLLARLLAALTRQQTSVPEPFTFGVVVADNDAAGSAQAVVQACAARGQIDVRYTQEPRPNIALARNAALREARGTHVAFIDDDEFPREDWLARMLEALVRFDCAGVLGPVRPHFEHEPPRWLVRGGFCERPEHPSGRPMPWDECRTGNVLLRRSILADEAAPFDEAFGSGGEDKDFFQRMTARGHVFVWCHEGIVHETVPPERWTRQYMLRRALLRGRNILKHPGQRMRLLATSVLATPLYLALLPLALPFGQHVFMKVCIRLCDHAGRLLGVLGLNPVSAR